MSYKKYARIYSIFVQNAISYEAQYRKDTWLRFVFNLLWIGMVFLFIEVFFTHTQNIGGWTKEHMYVLTFFWIVVDELGTLFFGKTYDIPNLVTNGSLDFYFTKPANTLFLVTTEHVNVRGIYRFLTEIVLFSIFLIRADLSPTATHVVLAVLLLIGGVVVNYAVRLLMNTLSFWFYRIDNINDLWLSFSDAGKYPLHILPKTLRVLFLSFVPIAFTAYIPTAALLGMLPWYGVAYAVLFSLFLFVTAVAVWNMAVKRYTSASS